MVSPGATVGPHAGRCCLGSLIATTICSFCHGCLFSLRRSRKKIKEKGKQTKNRTTLIRSNRTVAALPPPRSLFPSPRCLFSIYLLPTLLCSFLAPLPVSLPLSTSRGASVELAVVTRLMDDSESGNWDGVGRGGWIGETRPLSVVR